MMLFQVPSSKFQVVGGALLSLFIVYGSLFTVSAQVEKAIETVEKPTVSLCVASGDVTVRGWQRAEVRVFVEDGGECALKVKERSDNKPAWLLVQNAATKPNQAADECLRGEKIIVEVPFEAKVGLKIGASGGDILVDNVARAFVESIDGDIVLRNINGAIEASSLSGGITVEDSSGTIALKTFDGDITIVRARPADFTDRLKVTTTSGNVALRDVTHKIIEGHTTSGELVAVNSLAVGGNYDFGTSSGQIVLQLPADFSFQIKAAMSASGNLRVDFPVKFSSQTFGGGGSRMLTGTNGTGETAINLTAFNGQIWLKKK